MLSKLFSIYKPARFITPLSKEEAGRLYPSYRLQVMLTIFWGYAGYYFVRSNFSLAKPYLIKEMGLTTGDLGLIATGLSLAYGVSKFVMGSVSDRSNPRYFMSTGLIASGIINLFFTQLHSVPLMAGAWFLNGWFQGMGWAPCARILTHWFSDRERGTKFAVWNVAHNVGAGLAGPICSVALMAFASWTSLFYAPALLSIIMGVLIMVFLRDTPQSVGLPSIEEFKNDYPETGVADREKEMTAKEIFLGHIVNNQCLWILAFANLFVYVVRYGVLTWAPTYLMTVKCCSGDNARWLFATYEYAGIPGMLVAGWMTDRFFHGRRGPVGMAYMAVVTAAVAVYWLNPPGHYFVDMAALATAGFFIYGPVMLIGVAAVDLVPKKAAGTAAGLTGLFGYVGGATIAELGIGKVVQHYGWNYGFMLVLISGALALALLALTWHAHERE
ncbi:MAG: phosphoglycerate transporter protein PgtP [Elusimicrobiales bacterium]|nr:phosphoglycerate transporter protein PgtP [Elusimicrobiales bacterium]